MAKNLPKRVTEWSNDDVVKWLKDTGNLSCVNQFMEHDIDGKSLLTLKEDDLKLNGLNIKKIGDVKRLYISIKKLQKDNMSVLFELGQIELFTTNNFYTNNKNEVN